MILTGTEIRTQVENGRIHIEPFQEDCLNPNSYNYHLGSRLVHILSLDVNHGNRSREEEIVIPPSGFVIEPGELYLGNTMEKIGSEYFTTSLIGRSSMGRLGLFLQISANLGHQTVCHQWTLEIRSCLPLRIYANQIIGQVSFWKPHGETFAYRGYYANYNRPTVSKGVEKS